MPDGTVKTLRHYKAATHSVGGEAGKQAWNDVRMANWVRMITNKQGEMLPPGTMVNNIEEVVVELKKTMKTLYNESERKLMRQYANAVKATDWKRFDINPSGTGTVNNAGPGKKMLEEAVRFQAQSTRAQATFGQDKTKLLTSRLWRMLGTYLKQGEKPSGRILTNRALNSDVTKRRLPAVGGYPAGLAPHLDRD